MTASNRNQSATADREIVISRLYDAPRSLVYRAFSEPEHLVQWWGPEGFTNTFHEFEMRPGGVWRFIMHGPDGTDYPNVVTFLEVIEQERLVYDHGDDNDPQMFRATVTFGYEDGKTRVTLAVLFPTLEDLKFAVEQIHAVDGGNQTLDRLGRHLTTMTTM